MLWEAVVVLSLVAARCCVFCISDSVRESSSILMLDVCEARAHWALKKVPLGSVL